MENLISHDLPSCPVLHPTILEFENPLMYIQQSIQKYNLQSIGMFKIVPPAGWNPPSTISARRNDTETKYSTIRQPIHDLFSITEYEDGNIYTFSEYEKKANIFKQKFYPHLVETPENKDTIASIVEKEYWSIIEHGYKVSNIGLNFMDSSSESKSVVTKVLVDYANDQDIAHVGSGFPRNDANMFALFPFDDDDDEEDVIGDEGENKDGTTKLQQQQQQQQQHFHHRHIPSTSRTSTPNDSSGDDDEDKTNPKYLRRKAVEKLKADRMKKYMKTREHYISLMKQGKLIPPDIKSNVKVDFSSPEYYLETGWNINNLSHSPLSPLKHVPYAIHGINIPWIYLGMIFSTFAWHMEDHELYSINYMHFGNEKTGTGKTWYGVPSSGASNFEALVRMVRLLRKEMRKKQAQFSNSNEPLSAGAIAKKIRLSSQALIQQVIEASAAASDSLYGLTTIISPALLKEYRIPVYRAYQKPGEFIITLPRAYHSGFSHGFNMAEACNFALYDWLPIGEAAIEKYRYTDGVGRAACFSHEELLLNIACNKDFPTYDPSHKRIIQASVSRMIESYFHDKAQLEEVHGLFHKIQIEDPIRSKRRKCITCEHICYFGAVICSCAKTRDEIVCLRDVKKACYCHPSVKILLYWFTDDQLRQIDEYVKQLCVDKI
jgi:JmjC domain, hydroxylase/C5HC2 zinc finger